MEVKNGVFQEDGKKKWIAYFNGQVVGESYIYRTAEVAYEKACGTYIDPRKKNKVSYNKTQPSSNNAPQAVSTKPNVNKRFEFLEKAVRMVADGTQPSVVVSGAGGLGKTYTVRKALKECGLEDYTLVDNDAIDPTEKGFVFVKGFSTAKNLYRTLYNNNGSVVVLDDTDSIFKCANSVNILKACLDSYSTRTVDWGAEMKRDDDLPRSFEFTGQVVFITNINSDDLDQAIRSRSMVIDLAMTEKETVDRMLEIAVSDTFLPEFSMDIKEDAIQFIDENKYNAKELSLRTLITVCKVRSEFPDSWVDMAKYIICK